MSHSPVTYAGSRFDAQSGPFTSAQALAAGLTRWHLAQLVRRHEVRRVLRDLYVPWDYDDTIEGRARAVTLVVPEHAIAVDRTAAWIWEVDVRKPQELDLPPHVEFFALRGNTRLRRSGVRSGERDLAASEVTSIAGVRVTTPVRTSLDLACRLNPFEALAAMDGLARTQGVTTLPLLAALPRFKGRRGVVQARQLVPLVDERAESAGESFTRWAIAAEGLLVPQPQYWVTVDGVPTYRLDLAYPRLKICVEYDGEEFHASDTAKEHDRRRRRWLRDHGWIVIVVTKDDFSAAARHVWLQELHAALLERSRGAA
jgi:hypothetical protein